MATIATETLSPQLDQPASRAVTLSVPAELGYRTAELAGDLTAWSPVPMSRTPDGGFSITLELPCDREWRYRFRVDGERWINDPDAADYAPGEDGGAVSLLWT